MEMTPSNDGRELTLYAVGILTLRRWRFVAMSAFLVAAVLVTPAALRPRQYKSLASFQPLSGTDVRSGLAGFAGQLGLALPTIKSDQSPEFYMTLLLSRSLLARIARDSFATREGGPRTPFVDLFEARKGPPPVRLEDAELILKEHLSVNLVRQSGVVEISVVTEWPYVSYGIASALMREVDAFNKESKQGQASAERQFVEGRLKDAGNELRQAEDGLQRFLVANRQSGLSPELTVVRERMAREVQMAQQVYTQLRQSYEDARIREVRDTPVISIVESPVYPTLAMPRNRLKRGLVGLLAGTVLGICWLIILRDFESRLATGDPDAEAAHSWLVNARRRIAQRAKRSGLRGSTS